MCTYSGFCGKRYEIDFLSFFFFFFFWGTGVWSQDLHFESLHQPLYLWWVFQDRVSQTICLGWLRTVILLMSASWAARITGVSHCCPALTPLGIMWIRNVSTSGCCPVPNIVPSIYSHLINICWVNTLGEIQVWSVCVPIKKCSTPEQKYEVSHVLVARTCNPSYSRGRDQNCSLRPSQANSSQILSWKYPTQERDGGVFQVIECLPASMRPWVQAPVL
jgi:hypothetical protein